MPREQFLVVFKFIHTTHVVVAKPLICYFSVVVLAIVVVVIVIIFGGWDVDFLLFVDCSVFFP